MAITDRLLALTSRGGTSLARVRIDELARCVLEAFGSRIVAEQVRTDLAIGETSEVLGDEGRLRFVLESPVANALDSLLGQSRHVVNVRTGAAEDGV